MTKEITTSYGVNLWRSIRDLWNELKCFFKIKVNNGAKTKFWKDEWHEEDNLESLFPDIYSLVLHQQSTMAELWTTEGWRFNFRRQLSDWEIPRWQNSSTRLGNLVGWERMKMNYGGREMKKAHTKWAKRTWKWTTTNSQTVGHGRTFGKPKYKKWHK